MDFRHNMALLLLSAISLLHVIAAVVTISGNDRQRCLNAHNTLRNLHVNTPAMVWDNTLAEDAQQWANHLASINLFQHASVTDQGENLYRKSVSAICSEASLSWYKEYHHYSYATTKTKTSGTAIGHFTQLVWRSSTKLGVGVANSADGGTYIVARYQPRGNFISMHYWETLKAARARVYAYEVQPRKHGVQTPDIHTLDPAIPCTDINKRCQAYLRYCNDHHYTSFFTVQCRKTCNFC